jgi:hypothetical protein
MRGLLKISMVFAMLSALAACGGSNPADATRAGVNRYIWAGALDTLSFLPLEAADPFSGLIVTGWGRVEGSSGLYRVTVYVQRGDLGTDSLRVAAFRQSGGGSTALGADSIRQIEDAILVRARQLRVGAAGGL